MAVRERSLLLPDLDERHAFPALAYIEKLRGRL
jgi:hypothetical protein